MTANQNGRYLKVNRFRKKKLFKFDRQGTMTVPQERTGPAFRSCSSSNLSVCIEMLRFCSSVDALCARTCSRNPVWASHAYLFTDGILNHWRSPSLTSTSDFRYFRHNGTIQVLKDGIYYVYSQVVDESVFGLKIAIFICKSLVSAISICASSVIWGAKSSEFKPVTVFCLGTVSQSTKWKYVLAICGERLPYYAAAPVFCATVLQRLRLFQGSVHIILAIQPAALRQGYGITATTSCWPDLWQSRQTEAPKHAVPAFLLLLIALSCASLIRSLDNYLQFLAVRSQFCKYFNRRHFLDFPWNVSATFSLNCSTLAYNMASITCN